MSGIPIVVLVLAACLGLTVCAVAAGDAPPKPSLRDWAGRVFSGDLEKEGEGQAAPWLWVRRQEHGALRRNQSVLGTPLQIGDRRFERGLGTHAHSEIVILLAGPGAEFQAQAGIDHNPDTGGRHGSVLFVVEAAGRELFRSGLCRGGEAPQAVKLKLEGARRVVLRVLDGGDGPSWDQADWAEARITMSDGTQLFLDELPGLGSELGLSRQIPFSFVYGGRSSAELLPAWKRTEQQSVGQGGRELRTVTWSDPLSGLEVRLELTLFPGRPALDWVLHFTHQGREASPLLEQVQALDLGIGVPPGEVMLHRAQGSTATASDFLPGDSRLEPDAVLNLAPNGGRSSDGVLPFFNLAWQGGGLAWAVGWSGQWAQQLRRLGAAEVRIQAGQQTLRAKLQPGEQIRSPRILLVFWQGGDRILGHNLLRRVILDHYSPRLDGEPALPPVSQNSWFVFREGNGTTEENQLRFIRAMPELGVEVAWLDAGWFEGGWPRGVGSWIPRADHFPRGLRPLSEEAHRLGVKFLVWFEPERVNPESRIAREHPEYVLGWQGGKHGDGLYNLGDPAARAWLTDHLSRCIDEYGIDLYRTDFNMPPLKYWQGADGPERQGLTENHYIQGLYALWDELRRRHPRLLFDDCASGGRRIDLEMISRSYPLSRSDAIGVPAYSAAWDQAQTAGLSLYVPIHATLAVCGLKTVVNGKPSLVGLDRYALRSAATAGLGLCQDTLAEASSKGLFQQVIAEVKALRPFQTGDFHPLTPIGVSETVWCAWQFHRPDLGQGCAVFFRRPQAAEPSFQAALKGLEPQGRYEATFVDLAQTRRLSGEELARLKVEIPAAPGSLLVTYRKLDR